MARSLSGASCVAVLLTHMMPAYSSPVTLFYETFDDVVFPGGLGSDPRIFGVPTTDGATDASTSTIGNADEDWYAGRFQPPEAGAPHQDVGVQQVGGSGNVTPVGLAEDEAGLIARIDTSNYENIEITFDWRTFDAGSSDKLVFGYFVGDLPGVISAVSPSLIDSANRSFDLRTDADGGDDGLWNWTGGGWIELLSAPADDSFTTEMFELAGAENGEVWIAFWLDNGEDDFAKLDNILVTGTLVPLPAALPLLLTGLLGFGLLRRRAA